MESFLGSGDLYIDRLNADGTRNGLFFAGNCKAFSIQANADIKEQTSKGRDTYGQVMTSATLAKPPALKLSLDQLDQKNLAMAFLGDVADIAVTAGTVSGENSVIPALDQYVRLAHRNITAATAVVSQAAGLTAVAWQATHAYLLNAYVIPTVPNGHFYKCTLAGTSGATEPTWSTAGAEVTDGTAKFTDQGLITLVSGTDYELVARTGMIRALTGGSVLASSTLTAAYSYGASAGFKVTGAIQPVIKAYLFLDGRNETNGKDCEVEVWQAQLRPTSAVDFLADDFTSLELEGTPVTPTGYTAPFEVKQYD